MISLYHIAEIANGDMEASKMLNDVCNTFSSALLDLQRAGFTPEQLHNLRYRCASDDAIFIAVITKFSGKRLLQYVNGEGNNDVIYFIKDWMNT